ncbi:MAG TPA: outer membrane beta-barrel protein [Acidobacteriota bacterium]|nr:outer membrane beta-barrel protein [Acidobacteriota bacterium]
MKKVLVTVLCVLFVSGAAVAGDFPRVELFGGYSFMKIDMDTEGLAQAVAEVAPGGSITYSISRYLKKGFNGSAAFNIAKSFGIVADFRYNRDRVLDFTILEGGSAINGNLKWRDISIMGGPRFTLRSSDKVTPFVHALAGMDYWTISGKANVEGEDVDVGKAESSSGLGVAVGGGLDVNVSRNVAIRLVQADYYLTRHGGERMNNINLAFGIVFRLGGD